MSKLLEIFGKAINVKTCDVMWHWLCSMLPRCIDIEYRGSFEQILELISDSKYEEAVEQINSYLDEFPDSTYARMASAVICLRCSQIDKAIEQLQSVYYREPFNTMALYGLGFCYEITDKQAWAIEFYQDCIKFKGHLQLPRQRLAAIYFKDGRIEDAIAQYEMLVEEYPDDSVSLNLLGHLYLAVMDYERADEVLSKAILIHPDNFSCNGNDEIAGLIESEQFDYALQVVEEQLDTIGELADLVARKGEIFAKAGDLNQAIRCYKKALRIEPSYLEAVIKLATIYLKCQRYALAIEQFRYALKLNEDVVDTYVTLASVQCHLGDKELALETLDMGASISQNSILLFGEVETLKHRQSQLGNPDKSLVMQKLINDAIAKANQFKYSFERYYSLAMLLMAVANVDKALVAMKAAVELNSDSTQATNAVILCSYLTNKKQDALGMLKKHGELPASSMLKRYYEVAILFCDDEKFNEKFSQSRADFAVAFNSAHNNIENNPSSLLENMGLCQIS